MNRRELLKKIEKLDEATILKMSPDVLAILTNDFEEELLKKFVTKAETNEGQRKLIRFIKDSYKKWKKETDQFWGMLGHETYPEYLLNMQVAIECGEVMVDEEERRSKRGELMSKIICQHEMMIASLDYMTDEELAKAEELANHYRHDVGKIPAFEAHIKELEEENQQLKGEKAAWEAEKSELTKKSELPVSSQEWYTGDYDELSADEIFTLRERLVFFATVLSLEHNKKYTVAINLETFIKELCNDQKGIGILFSRMKKPDEMAANGKAAKKVADLMKLIIPKEYRNNQQLRINQLIESMLLNYPESDED